jgi:antirestriction protein
MIASKIICCWKVFSSLLSQMHFRKCGFVVTYDNVDPQPVRSLEEWLIGDLFPYTRHSQIVSEAFILQSLASLQTSPKATKQGPTTVPIMAEAVVSRGSKQ